MMNLYSGTTCPFSHRCRIVLYEKGMDFQVIDVDMFNKPEDLAVINPHNRVPVLVERDLVLFEPNIINEYIDERFPHPQLMPADPIMRARARQLLVGMEREIFAFMEVIEKHGKSCRQGAAGNQGPPDRDHPDLQQAEVHARRRILDARRGDRAAALASGPLRHRSRKAAAPLMKYAERIFSRQGFIDALTPSEKAMRK